MSVFMGKTKKYYDLLLPQYWPAWLGIGILWSITKLPFRWQIHIGKTLGKLLYWVPSKLKHTTKTNIERCFPELSATDQTRLVKKSFASLGAGLIEAAMSWWLKDDQLKTRVVVNGLNYVQEAYTKGKGIILVGPHFTCLELIGRMISMEYEFAVMYRPHKKRFVSFIHERFRKKKYLHYIPRTNIRELIRALKNNIAVWYAYDIDAGSKRSVFAPFFGIQTASLNSVARLVNMTGAAVIPIGFYRRHDNTGYEINLYPPINDFPTNNLVTDATKLNAALECCIREMPEQYVWQYKRFKTRPPGEPRFY